MAQGRGQVRLLTRHFLRRFLDNDLIAPDTDLHTSVAGVVAALLIVSATVALAFYFKYNPYQPQTLVEKLALALDDKTLLLGGAMIVMALATVLAWDSLSLDSRDFAILGPLPIRPTVLLVSKTAALAIFVAVAAISINALPAVLFPAVVFATAPVSLAYGLQWMLAHAVAGVAGCAFTFAALASVRMALVLALPERVARRLLPALQFVLLLALLTFLLMLPLLATKTRLAIEAGSHAVYLWPPLWFLGLEELLIGRPEVVFLGLTRMAAVAFAVVTVVAAAAYLATFLAHPRRFGSLTPVAVRSTTPLLSGVLHRIAALVAPDALTRATFLFTAQTLARSARHRLCIAGYMGLGLACVAASILAARFGIIVNRSQLDLTSMAFAAQTNLVFFLLVGVRIAAGFPADLDAAWAFRLRVTPALRRYQAGTRWAFVLLGVLPLLLMLVPLHVALWGWYAALVHFAVGTVLALVLLDVLFRRSDRIPFVSAFAPARTVLSLRLPFYIFGYLLFVYVPPEIERIWIRNPDLFVAWAGLFVLIVARFLGSQLVLFRHDRMPVFDDEQEMQSLGLTGWARADGKGSESPKVRGSEGRSLDFPTLAPPARWLAIEPEGARASDAPAPRLAMPSWTWQLEQLGQELRFTLRRLRAAPGFTLFAAVTLALGIGVTIAIYSVIDAAILTPPDIRHIDYVVNLYHSNPREGGRSYIAFSFPDYEDLRASQTVFSHLAGWTEFQQTLVANGAGETVVGELVSGDYFEVVGALPRLGRVLQPADDRPDAAAVAVLSHDLWRRRFASDPAVVGKTVRMNGRVFEVVGVAAAPFRGVFSPSVIPTAVWVPLQHAGLLVPWAKGESVRDRENRWLFVKGFLRQGRTIADASAEVKTIARRLDAAYPIGRDVPLRYRWTPAATRSWVVTPAADVHVHESVDAFVLPFAGAVMAAVGLVLLVACTNLANLMLARGAARRQELAVRLALGASRWRLVGEQVVESGVVALLGGCGAVIVARAIMTWVGNTTLPLVPGFGLHVMPGFNVSVAIVAVGATALALLVFGLAPAIQLTRTDVRSALSADTANVAVPRWRGRGNLIAGQVAVSVALLAVAGIYAHDVVLSSLRDVGLDLDRIALVRLDLQMQGYDEQRSRQTLGRILDLVSHEPGVDAAAISSGVPSASEGESTSLALPDRASEKGRTRGPLISATPDIFRALGVRVLRGRPFDTRDTAESGRVVVLSGRAARDVCGGANPVGRTVLVDVHRTGEGKWGGETATIVGVAADAGERGGQAEPGVVYVPFTQHYAPRVTIVARAKRPDAAGMVRRVRDLSLRVDRELAILDAGTGVALSRARSVFPKIIAALAAVLAVLALALAMAGLYGVLSYIVAGRTREVGVRMALGATRPRILAAVLYDGMRPVLEGIAVGLGLAALAAAALQPLITRVMPAVDPLTFSLLPIPFVVAALVACYLPARRAAGVDPNVALRQL